MIDRISWMWNWSDRRQWPRKVTFLGEVQPRFPVWEGWNLNRRKHQRRGRAPEKERKKIKYRTRKRKATLEILAETFL